MNEILNISSPEWMCDPNRNCHIPAEFSPQEARAIADQWLPTPILERAATRLCRGCPVVEKCLMYALDNPELEGVWGKTTTAQRQAMLSKSAS